ncbi:hypothetical protein [Streptomyces sp. NPDC048282]|uniref:hypothetical protein n=1 Tax=Streptomyces sp. NPDC048282 TaxID=3365528 RepID=UPI00371736F9
MSPGLIIAIVIVAAVVVVAAVPAPRARGRGPERTAPARRPTPNGSGLPCATTANRRTGC